MFRKCIYVLLISMLPVVELRVAIPIGIGMDIPFWLCYLMCVIGNMVPVPFLIAFSKSVLAWFARQHDVEVKGKNALVRVWYKTVGFIGTILFKANARADEKAKTIGKYELLGLFLFVAIPLPGTGAWTGSLIAAVLRLRLMKATLAILCGVMAGGLIMGVLSFGVFGLFGI